MITSSPRFRMFRRSCNLLQKRLQYIYLFSSFILNFLGDFEALRVLVADEIADRRLINLYASELVSVNLNILIVLDIISSMA